MNRFHVVKTVFIYPGLILGLVLFLFSTPGGAGEKLISGLAEGKLIPGSFTPFNINGKGQGRYHSLVTEFGLDPVVMVFARDPGEEKDGLLLELLQKLDKAVARHQDAYLHGCVVFISRRSTLPGAKPEAVKKDGKEIKDDKEDKDEPKKKKDTSDDKEERKKVDQKIARLRKEAINREALDRELKEKFADKLKEVVICHFPPGGPEKFNINEKMELTIIFYQGYEVKKNVVIPEGKLDAKAVENLIRMVDDNLRPGKSKKK